jgi:hypothetical protein
MSYTSVSNLTDMTDGGANIQIQIDANTVIFCKAVAGTAIDSYGWKIFKQTQSADALFSNYPYIRVTWAVIPSGLPNAGQVSSDNIFKASDALTLTFL